MSPDLKVAKAFVLPLGGKNAEEGTPEGEGGDKTKEEGQESDDADSEEGSFDGDLDTFWDGKGSKGARASARAPEEPRDRGRLRESR